jgi:hypothetical protein
MVSEHYGMVKEHMPPELVVVFSEELVKEWQLALRRVQLMEYMEHGVVRWELQQQQELVL